jgi:hypothetical protein
MSRSVPSGLISQGFQKITTNSTATGLNSTCAAGNDLLMSVETQSVRITFDGSTPAASTGVLLIAANSPYFFPAVPCNTIKIARATAGAIVNVQTFKR